MLLKEMPPLKGNFVNPRATVSLQPESFRFPAPNSQPEYENDMTSPNKEHDIDTIQYAPRSSRLYKGMRRRFSFHFFGILSCPCTSCCASMATLTHYHLARAPDAYSFDAQR